MDNLTPLNEVIPESSMDYTRSIYDNLKQHNKHLEFCGCVINNNYAHLSDAIDPTASVRLIPIRHSIGKRILEKTVAFYLVYIFKKHFGEHKLIIEHVVNGGLFCLIDDQFPRTDTLKKLSALLNDFKDIQTHSFHATPGEIIQLLKEKKESEVIKSLHCYQDKSIVAYKSDDVVFLSDFPIAPGMDYFQSFEVSPLGRGFMVNYIVKNLPSPPQFYLHQKQLFKIFTEYENWTRIMGINQVSDINTAQDSRKIREIIQIAETFHEKKLAEISAHIYKHRENRRLILIAGPSSSGKTTFSKRLAIHLKTYGLHSVPLSLDDYFIDRQATPLDADGKPDFESIKALDLDLLNEHLVRLLQGETVAIPEYDFKTGSRSTKTHDMQLSTKDLLIVEGIHGLNEELTKAIPAHMKYKIYVSAITPLNLGPYNRISSSDNRLLRRIVRDSKYRGHSAEQTLSMWSSVRAGEEKNIFPFQEEADTMFNSALVYELIYLRSQAEPLLQNVPQTSVYYAEAQRLLYILNFIRSYDHPEQVPPTSILREFLGGSSLHY